MFRRIFGDAGFRYSCMRSVRGSGLGAIGMNTRVVELCVVEFFVVCSFADVGFKSFYTRSFHGRGLGTLGMNTRVGELWVC